MPSELSVHAQPTFAAPTTGTLDDLGISLDVFRELRLLQMREITADDYDLLMLLHSKPSTKVLDESRLSQVTETFFANEAWHSVGECTVCLDPMSPGDELCRLACNGRHIFHRECICEWLRSASRCCPIDQQDLSL